MTLAQPILLWAALVILPLLYFWLRRGRVKVSTVSHYRGGAVSFMLSWLPTCFIVVALCAGAVVLSKPQVPKADGSTAHVMGRDIMFGLDYSSSMAEEFKGELPKRAVDDPFVSGVKPYEGYDPNNPDTTKFTIRRIEAAQAAILRFVDMRRLAKTGDAIGLIAFDDVPLLRWPLDRDLKQIARHGQFVPPGKGQQGLGFGTNFGTVMPGPIDMAVKHFKERGQSTTRVLILVSDGENDLTPEVKARLVNLIKGNNIRFYLLGIGDKVAKGEVDIARVCEKVNGKLFPVASTDDLDRCFDEINKLESSPVPVTTFGSYEPAFQWLLAIAMVAAVLWALFEGVISGR